MIYKSGDMLELENGKTVRLNADTAAIANAAAMRMLPNILVQIEEGNADNEKILATALDDMAAGRTMQVTMFRELP
jgi:hypothetical protein